MVYVCLIIYEKTTYLYLTFVIIYSVKNSDDMIQTWPVIGVYLQTLYTIQTCYRYQNSLRGETYKMKYSADHRFSTFL